MSKAILNFIDKHAPTLLQFKKNVQMRFNNDFFVESEFETELQMRSEMLIGKKIYELKRTAIKLESEKNEISKQMLFSRARGEQVDPELQELEELLDTKIRLLEKAIELKQQYQRQPTYEVDRNFLDHPLFSATTPNEKTLNELRTKDGIIEIRKEGFRRLFYRNENGNLLTTYDLKVFVGLFKLWGDKGRNATFEFTFNELANVLYAEKSGGEYGLFEKSLNNLAQTSIIMEEYFNPKTGKRTRTVTHNPISTAIVDGQEYYAKIEFSNYLHDSLEAGNVVVISMALFNDLASPTSKNLYLTITNRIKDEEFSMDLDTLIQHIGLHGNTRYKCVQTIKESFQELKDFGFLSDFEVIKRGNLDKRVVFTPSNWAKEVYGQNLSLAALEVSAAGVEDHN
ncbi:hypothetical protein ACFQ88_39390 [Paenibacillus sp. NPDC056579]|uniref:hypothetical protein n=1 Tax=Paenibacillus sp. NPDC056579 TaxID=3345871 RepID=UPI00368F96F4